MKISDLNQRLCLKCTGFRKVKWSVSAMTLSKAIDDIKRSEQRQWSYILITNWHRVLSHLIKSPSTVYWGRLPRCPVNAGKKPQNRDNEHTLPTCNLTLIRVLQGLCVLSTKTVRPLLSAGGKPCRFRQEWQCWRYRILTWQADCGETSKTDHSFLTFSWIPSCTQSM